MDLKNYFSEFETHGEPLKVGSRTTVRILSLAAKPEAVPYAVPSGCEPIRIAALIELSAVVERQQGTCDICDTAAPVSDDALWFILKNHDGGRIVFPDVGDCRDERDRYPVEGWVRTDGDLICASCYTELEKAKQALRSSKNKGA